MEEDSINHESVANRLVNDTLTVAVERSRLPSKSMFQDTSISLSFIFEAQKIVKLNAHIVLDTNLVQVSTPFQKNVEHWNQKVYAQN